MVVSIYLWTGLVALAVAVRNETVGRFIMETDAGLLAALILVTYGGRAGVVYLLHVCAEQHTADPERERLTEVSWDE